MELAGSETEKNLRRAFGTEAENVLSLLYLARRADIDGNAELASSLRALADGKSARAFAHLEFLEDLEPLSWQELVSGGTPDYDRAARRASEEKLEDVADWFSAAADAQKQHERYAEKVQSDIEVKRK